MSSFDVSEHYDEEYFRWQARHGLLQGEATAFIFRPFLRGSMNILDFGCGDGSLLTVLGGKSGVEINPSAIEIAQSRGIEVRTSLSSYPPESFDAIVTNHALEHVEDPIAKLREILTLLRSGGVFIGVVPCDRANTPFNLSDQDMHLFSWSSGNFGNLVRAAGFNVVRAEEIVHRWPPKWHLIQRLGGWRAFHTTARIWARLDRSRRQVRVVARKPIKSSDAEGS